MLSQYCKPDKPFIITPHPAKNETHIVDNMSQFQLVSYDPYRTVSR
ncbi:hypothetical protein ESCAB7627_2780 [Escherichia albertii TW07627]|uniref:Uncharacterized protein n=1 Tax=Escherichia albertii (strain TW07627) TaxID=502347 RepID=A0ABC9NLZ0_ESCAT|nr:hypothetical protein ESCAB7627_2780 [Escherichia albertii TW07627]